VVFADSIPENGKVVVIPEPHVDTYLRVAADRDCKVLMAEPDAVTEDQLQGFGYLVLPDHVALVLAVTRELGIPDEVAMRGMRNAAADPFAMRVVPIGEQEQPGYFVNGFAVNDPMSTLAVWDHIADRSLGTDGLTVIVNCRADRMDRTTQFATDVLPHLPIDTLVVTGQQTRPILRAAESDLDVAEVLDLTGAPADRVVAALNGHLPGRVVYGIGNLHGGGVQLVAALEALAIDDSERPGVA
jgi:gamma-polyglutamate synthase